MHAFLKTYVSFFIHARNNLTSKSARLKQGGYTGNLFLRIREDGAVCEVPRSAGR